MYEIYAIAAAFLLLFGIVTLVYYVKNASTFDKNIEVFWTSIAEKLSVILLGSFYVYSAAILSQNGAQSDPVLLPTIDDFAIVNATEHDEIDLSAFLPSQQTTTPPVEQHNEIEDTRNNKNKGTASEDFVKLYQSLVQSSIRRKPSNVTREQRSVSQDRAPLLVEDQDCFLKQFLYQALLTYSFVSSAISLVNVCKMCDKSPKEEEPPSADRKHPSQTFGEKIEDTISENSSENVAPVGPLFEPQNDDSTTNSTPGLEVFSVKLPEELRAAATPSTTSSRETNEKNLTSTAVKCLTILIIPIVLVSVLYVIMRTEVAGNGNDDATLTDILPNFNGTRSAVPLANLVRNDTELPDEVISILRNVYSAIDKFKDGAAKLPAPGEKNYFFLQSKKAAKTPEECTLNGNEQLGVKAFDFVILIGSFFAATMYAKLKVVQMHNSKSQANKCFMAFLLMWTPSLIDVGYSKILTNRSPTSLSLLLLLVGNLEKLFASKANIDIHRTYNFRHVNPSSTA